MLRREKIRKAKIQLEIFNMATVVKGNKKSFYKYINNTRRAREKLHTLLDVAGNIITENKEKAEVPHVFFASVFKNQINYPQDAQPPELEDRKREQNKPP